MTRTEETVGGLIKGVYSYVDPVGSLIEVTYSMNVDKTNYMEERKVMKNYVNSQATGRKFFDIPTLRPVNDATEGSTQEACR